MLNGRDRMQPPNKPVNEIVCFYVSRRFGIRLVIDLHDLWVGLYWKHDERSKCYRFYVCLLPMVVIEFYIG